jgi:hypothetical protein
MANEEVMASDSIDPTLDAEFAAPASGRYPRYGKPDALRGRS